MARALTLEDLLVKPQRVELPGGLKVFIRRLSQIERDLCTAAARRMSRDWRKILEDPKSDEHQLLVADEVNLFDKEALRASWVNSRLLRKALLIDKDSLESRDETYVAEPEGDDLLPSDIEHYENEVEDIEEQREVSVKQRVEAAQKELNKEVEKLSLEDLRANAEPAQIDAICSDQWTTEYVAQMITRGTFKDKECSKPAFKTANEVKRLQAPALEALSNAHMGLLVNLEDHKLKISGGEQKS